jgi:hypothetical protein
VAAVTAIVRVARHHHYRQEQPDKNHTYQKLEIFEFHKHYLQEPSFLLFFGRLARRCNTFSNARATSSDWAIEKWGLL